MAASELGRKTVAIDSRYLDLEICGRCRGADASLETALATVGSGLEAAGADVRVTRTLVDSEESACCDAREQESCCEPPQKASCCGPRRERDARACGCR